jgi:hypothetical protein
MKDVAEACVAAMCQMYYGLTVKQLRDKRININDIHVQSYKYIDEGASFIHGVIVNQGVSSLDYNDIVFRFETVACQNY